MAAMNDARAKGGRPPVGPTIHLKLPPDLIQHLDAVAREWGTTRSEAARRLLRLALAR
jgi:hypothetical protein